LLLEYLGYRSLTNGPAGIYADPQLTPCKSSALLPASMVQSVTKFLSSALEPTAGDVSTFLGQLLSAPKPHVVFRRPGKKRRQRFQLETGELALVPASRALVDGETFFINGMAAPLCAPLQVLAEERKVVLPAAFPRECEALLTEWFEEGWISHHEKNKA